jgi:tetratricopeptide (TPR) repeat protein
VLSTCTAALTGSYRRVRTARAEHHFEEGRVLSAAGEAKKAIEEFRAAMHLAPTNRLYRLELALAVAEAGRWDEAELRLAELRERDPTNAVVNRMLARLAARRGQTAVASTCYQRAIYGQWPNDRDRQRLQTRLEFIRFLSRAGRSQQLAAQALETAGETADPEVRSELAAILMRHGLSHHAVDLLKQALETESGNERLWMQLGDAYFFTGEFRDAETAFRRAQRLAPEDSAASHKVQAAREVSSLDPSQVRLTTRERWARSREVMQRAIAALSRCTAAQGTTLPEGATAELAAARELLKARYRRGAESTHFLEAAERVWTARQELCAATPEVDEPLAILMTRLRR